MTNFKYTLIKLHFIIFQPLNILFASSHLRQDLRLGNAAAEGSCALVTVCVSWCKCMWCPVSRPYFFTRHACALACAASCSLHIQLYFSLPAGNNNCNMARHPQCASAFVAVDVFVVATAACNGEH